MENNSKLNEIMKTVICAFENDSAENSKNYAGFREKTRRSVRELLRAMFPNQIGIPDNFQEQAERQACTAAISETDNACFNADEPGFCRPEREKLRKLHLINGAASLKEALLYVSESEADAEHCTAALLERLPYVRSMLLTDMDAAYEGDPAAKSTEEILLAYPGFMAIGMYRIAHELYIMNIPLIPRMITEYAHERTGIDIHPGATIDHHFFIDHGTGVVIGETTTIGHHVKLYQHVTLGAKSFPVGPDGTLIKGIKRHPHIGNNVIIYAGATILGGDTAIGDNCVIGGNVWLTHSVAPGKTVTAAVNGVV